MPVTILYSVSSSSHWSGTVTPMIAADPVKVLGTEGIYTPISSCYVLSMSHNTIRQELQMTERCSYMSACIDIYKSLILVLSESKTLLARPSSDFLEDPSLLCTSYQGLHHMHEACGTTHTGGPPSLVGFGVRWARGPSTPPFIVG